VYEVSKTSGTVLFSMDLTSQGVAGIAGLSFNTAGQLLVASTDGVVFVANLTTQAQLALPTESAVARSQAAALTSRELAPVVNSAIALWAATGIGTTEVDQLRQVAFRITDLPGAYVGLATPGTVYLDSDADGYGWFVDATAIDQRDFSGTDTAGAAVAPEGSSAWGHMDLLTVVAHELGHELGLSDDSDDDLMGQFLATGVRRLPAGLSLPSAALAGTRSYVAAAAESVSAPVSASAIDRAIQAVWGTDDAESHSGMTAVALGSGQSVAPGPGPIRLSALGNLSSSTPNGPPSGRSRGALDRTTPQRALALAIFKRTRAALGSRRITGDADHGNAGRRY
jgi:hypothetical protein